MAWPLPSGCYISPALGHLRLDQVRRQDVQQVMDGLRMRGLSPSTVRDAMKPLQVIYRTARRDDLVQASPCDGVELDRTTGKRERVATPDEAAALIEALPDAEQALWAVAFYAGLRQGELGALRWEDVDLEAGVLHVRGSWDFKHHQRVETKSTAGSGRKLAISGVLKPYLFAHLMLTGRRTGLVFGRDEEKAFTTTWKNKLAKRAWEQAGINPITMHECRHSFASFLIASGANVKDVQTAMGHATVQLTARHLRKSFPGARGGVGREAGRVPRDGAYGLCSTRCRTGRLTVCRVLLTSGSDARVGFVPPRTPPRLGIASERLEGMAPASMPR